MLLQYNNMAIKETKITQSVEYYKIWKHIKWRKTITITITNNNK
ncbi:hypothetical protein DOY81_008686 [Sarcophaga bullata]|nr:hypothetical protein DOY81_008686 [Sarcophaga bullata]